MTKLLVTVQNFGILQIFVIVCLAPSEALRCCFKLKAQLESSLSFFSTDRNLKTLELVLA